MDTETYFVANYGNDSNSGGINDPFATIQAALDHVDGGGTIYLREGTYYPSSELYLHSGTAEEHLILSSYNGEKAVIDGSQISNCLNLINIQAEYVDITGLEVRNSPGGGIEAKNAKHINIENNIVHDVRTLGIRAQGDIFSGWGYLCEDIHINGNTVYRSNLSNVGENKGKENWSAAVSSLGADNVEISNNQVYENGGEGISFILTKNGVASHNIVHDNFSVNMYLDNANNSVFDGNFVYNTGNRDFYLNDRPANGIQLANESYNIQVDQSQFYLDNNKIINNVVADCFHSMYYGTYVGWGNNGINEFGLRNILIANNTFYNPDLAFINFENDPNTNNANIINNIFYQTKSGYGSDLHGNTKLNFASNLWYGTDAGAAWSSTDIYADPLLINAGSFDAKDYQLSKDSPAINAGIFNTEIYKDFLDIQRPVNNNYDIGAFEYIIGF